MEDCYFDEENPDRHLSCPDCGSDDISVSPGGDIFCNDCGASN